MGILWLPYGIMSKIVVIQMNVVVANVVSSLKKGQT